MSEMIERIARRFAASEGWDWDDLHETDDTSFGWARNRIRARVFDDIREMREPTEAMSLAGRHGAEPDCHLHTGDAAGVWRAMIAAALKYP